MFIFTTFCHFHETFNIMLIFYWYFSFYFFFFAIILHSISTVIDWLNNFEIFFWILFIFTEWFTWINFWIWFIRRITIELWISKKTKFIITWRKFLNELQNIIRCLIILFIHIFPKWDFVLILRLHLIREICKAATLLITYTSCFIGFELRLLYNIWILF